MKVAVCNAQSYDRQSSLAANNDIGHELVFFDSHLCEETQQMVAGFTAVCAFVNDTLNNAVLKTLAAQGTRLVALRRSVIQHCANHATEHQRIRARWDMRE